MNITQKNMYKYLKENIHSHEIEMTDNKILGKRIFKSSSFRSFTITFLKNSDEVSIVTNRGRALRYNNKEDLFSMMGAFSQLGMKKK